MPRYRGTTINERGITVNPPGDAHKMPKTGILALVRTAQQVRSPTARIRDFHSKEFQILMLLAQNKGRVFSKEQIYNIV